LFGDLRPYVEMALASNKKYICELDQKPLGSFRKTWLTACKAAGVPGLLFHDLRRSAVRNMIQAGVPESVAMKISGHKTQSMLLRYNIIAERDVVKAGQRVEEHLKTASIKLGEETGESRKPKNAPN
jgi:integrase